MTGLTLMLTVSGCAGGVRTGSGEGSPSPVASAPTAATARTGRPSSPGSTARRDDLSSGRAAQTFPAGNLSVNATYATTLPTTKWTPSATKQVDVTVSAMDNASGKTKVYLSRVTCTISASDDTGPIAGPSTLTDTANINPGYLASFPYSYEQVFTVPTVDEGATGLTFSFKYELLTAVSDDTKDYTKQTAVSTIQVPLA